MGYLFFGIWNLLIFFLYGIDKNRAMSGRWRISEQMLISLSFCMGAVGSIVGIFVFNHKIRKVDFILKVFVGLLFNVLLVYTVSGI